MAEATRFLPRLETGDHLTRDEFHRRYCARPDIRRAELIQGVVYVPLPTRFTQHDEPTAMITTWLGVYAMRVPGVRLGGSPTIYLEADSEVQPDGVLFREPPSWTGGARRRSDGYLEGAPDLVVEVAASSAAYDLNTRLAAYQRVGVPEYIVWRTLEAAVDWFHLRHGVYQRLTPNAADVIESEVFPGLRLDVPKLLAGDLAGVVAGLGSPER